MLRTILALVIVTAGAAGSFVLFDTRPRATPATPDDESWPVALTEVSRGPASPSLALFGRLESPNLARLSSALTADVVSVEVEEGALVETDAVLIRLDARDAELHLRQRNAEVADLEAQLELELERRRTDERSLVHEQALLDLTRSSVKRAEDMARRNLGSQSQLDLSRQEETRQRIALESRRSALRSHQARVAQLQARLSKAIALRDQATLDLARTTIKAPFGGRVTRVPVAPGNRVRPGDPLVSLFDRDKVEVRAQIPSRQLPLLRNSLERDERLNGTLEVDGQQLTVYLHRLAGQADEGQGGIDGLFRLDTIPSWLRLGRTVELRLELDRVVDAIALPLSALYGRNRIFKVVDDRMVGIDVERVGERRTADGLSEILVRAPELSAGDKVVITQLPNATDGLLVRSGL